MSALVAGALIIKESDFFREFVAAEVSKRLQRTVTFSDIDIDLDIDKSISVKATDIVIAQPAGFDGPDFLNLGSAALNASIPDLLLGQPKINALKLSQAKLYLIQGTQGQANWKFPLNESSPSTVTVSKPGGTLPVLLEHADIKDLQLTLVDSREEIRTLKVNATLKHDESGATLSVLGDINEAPLRVKIEASSADALTTLTDVNLSLDMQLGDVRLTGKALVGDLTAPARPQVNLALEGPSVEYFTDLLNLPPLSRGPLDLRVSMQPGIERMVVRLDGLIGDFSAVVSGEVDNLRVLSQVDMAVAINGPDLGRLGDLVGAANVPHVPFSATGKVTKDQQRLNIPDSRINIGRLQIAAALEIPNLHNPTQANLSAEASVPAIEVFQDILNLPSGLQGAVTAQVSLKNNEQNTAVNSLISTEYGELQATGELRGAREFTGTSMTLSATGDDLSTLLELVGQRPGFHDDWAIETDLMVTKNHVELSAGKLSLQGASSDFTAIFPRENPGDEFTVSTANMRVTNPRKTLSYWLKDENSLSLIPSQAAAGSLIAEWSTDTLNLRDLDITLSDMNAQGVITVIPKQKAVLGDLSLGGKNLTELLPPQHLPSQIPTTQLDQPLNVTSKFTIEPETFKLSSLNLKVGDLTVDGGVEFSQGTFDVDALIAADNAYGWAVIDNKGNKKTPEEPLAITAKVSLSQSGTQMSVREFTLNTAAGGSIHSQGEVEFGETFSGTGLKIAVDLPDLQRLGWLAGLALPKIPLQVNAAFSGDASQLSASKLSVNSLDSEFSGRLSISDPSHPKIQLALHSSRVDLRPFYDPVASDVQNEDVQNEAPATSTEPTSHSREKSEPELEKTASKHQKSASKGKSSGPKNSRSTQSKKKKAANKKVIPIADINLEILQRFDAEVNFTIDKLIGHKRRFNDVELISKVQDGALLVDNAAMKSDSGGLIELSGFAVPGDEEYYFGLTIEGSNIKPMLPNSAIELDELAALPGANFSGELSGAGTSLRELAGSLNGSLQITTEEGVIPGELSGFFTNGFLSELLSLLNPLEDREAVTHLQCMVAFAEVLEGKVEGDPFATIVSDEVAIVSKAHLNLHNEKLFMSFNTVPQKGLGISASSAFNPFVGVAGTLARPQVTVDAEGALIQGSLAVATGGISLIGKSFIDRLSVSKKSCDKAEAKFISKRAASQKAFKRFRQTVLSSMGA